MDEKKKHIGRPKVDFKANREVQWIEGYLFRVIGESETGWAEAKLVDIQTHLKMAGFVFDLATISRRLKWLVDNDYFISRRKYPRSADTTIEYSRTPEQELARPDIVAQYSKQPKKLPRKETK